MLCTKEIDCCHVTITQNHRMLWKIKKLGAWVPHELSVNNKMQHVALCSSLISPDIIRMQYYPFLSIILQPIGSGTCTSLWRNRNSGIVQINKRLLKSRMNCTLKRPYGGWWIDVIHFVLPQNSVIIADLYSQHLRSWQKLHTRNALFFNLLFCSRIMQGRIRPYH